MIPSTQAPKWPILVSLWGMDHQKSTILLISGTVSVGGCGGQECYNKPNPRVISQMHLGNMLKAIKKCQICHNLLIYLFTLFHFALGDPVVWGSRQLKSFRAWQQLLQSALVFSCLKNAIDLIIFTFFFFQDYFKDFFQAVYLMYKIQFGPPSLNTQSCIRGLLVVQDFCFWTV